MLLSTWGGINPKTIVDAQGLVNAHLVERSTFLRILPPGDWEFVQPVAPIPAYLGKRAGNGPTLDATLLEFDVFSTNSIVLEFQYVFASEEYPEWIGQYHDPMAIFVSTNRVGSQWICEPTNNIALVPCTTNVFVGVGTVNDGDADGWATPTNSLFYLDNHDPLYSAAEPNAMDVSVFDVQYDGMTVLLAAHAVVTANVTNRLKIGVADYAGVSGTDRVYDSVVLLKAWSLVPCE